MPVQGVTTASVAQQPYQPPFSAGASQPALTPTVTGSTGNTPQVTSNPNPVVPTNVPQTAYIMYYLAAHMTSWPSYRYAYIMWMVFAIMAFIYTMFHHFKVSSGTTGATYNKWGMRCMKIGPFALPSNSVLVISFVIVAVAIVLSFVGSDYFAPQVGTFSHMRKRAYIGGPMIPGLLVSHDIQKSTWTLANRFGFMTFALFPLVILFAVKARPMAVLSYKWLTYLYSDKLVTFHRITGFLIWGMTTAHVVLWTIQLFRDVNPNTGKAMWFTAFQAYRFIFGCIAYFLLTLLMATSVRPIRKAGYEFFYYAHVTLTLLTLVACIVHHPAIWWWVAIALLIWLIDRAWRAMRWVRLNRGKGSVSTEHGRYTGLPTDDIVMEEFHDKMLPATPGNDHNPQSPGHNQGYSHNSYSNRGYDNLSPEIQPTGTFDSTPSLPGSRTPSARFSRQSSFNYDDYTRPRSAQSNAPAALTAQPPVIPPGYAQAQLLPSRLIRLTIRTPKPLDWSPGQSVLLCLPELSKLQSHPFTICNNDPNEMVLLIKARRGLTRQLYNTVRERFEASMRANDKQLGNTTMPPIYLRAMIDGPHGSAGRVNWNEFSTVLLICGGSGVSFGLSILDHLTKLFQPGRGKTMTRRVRFVWVAREYAELAWAASALCRARNMIPSSAQLQIDIYVTNAEPMGYGASSSSYRHGDELAPPRPGYAKGGMSRSSSADSLSSMVSSNGGGDQRDNFDLADEEMAYAGGVIADYTNYESDEDEHDPAEEELSRRIQKQGKIRRAKGRKQRGGARTPEMGGYQGSSSYPPSPGLMLPGTGRHQRVSSGGSHLELPPGAGPRMDMGDKQGLLAEPTSDPKRFSSYSGMSGYSGLSQGGNRPMSHAQHGQYLAEPGSDPNRASYISAGYDAFDPYHDRYNDGGPFRSGLSPSPSLMFDETDSVRKSMSMMSRTQSMILLEDVANEPLMRKGLDGGSVGLWIDEADYAAMTILSEAVRAGRPKLSHIIDEEIAMAQGSIVVGTCGPRKLNRVARNLVSRNIRPGMIMRGDQRGHVAIYSEEYET